MTLRFLIKFRSLPAVGAPTNSIVPSDTLSAALGWAASEAGDYDIYADALLQGNLIVSSVFPRDGRTYFYPCLRNGELQWLDDAGNTQGLKLVSWERKCAVLHRLTCEADVFRRGGRVWQRGGAVLEEAHFLAVVPKSLAGAFATWVRLLGDAGVGGYRSAGAGGFDVERVEDVPVRREGPLLLLSLAVPELPEVPERHSALPWVLREGYTDWRWRGVPDARKAGIAALPEGLVVGKPFAGKVLELDGRACIYSGLAFLYRTDRHP